MVTLKREEYDTVGDVNLSIGHNEPDEDFNVFETEEVEVAGATFTLEIIGSSHYVYSEDADYYEVCSCTDAPLGDDVVGTSTMFVNNDMEASMYFESDERFAKASANIVPISMANIAEMDDIGGTQLQHDFDEQAETFITVFSGQGTISWHTLHKYPEYDQALQTSTSMVVVE